MDMSNVIAKLMVITSDMYSASMDGANDGQAIRIIGKKEKVMENKNSSTGVGFIGLLTLVFIVLKLCKVINWSWLWVLSPLWIGLIAYIVIVLILIRLIRRG